MRVIDTVQMLLPLKTVPEYSFFMVAYLFHEYKSSPCSTSSFLLGEL